MMLYTVHSEHEMRRSAPGLNIVRQGPRTTIYCVGNVHETKRVLAETSAEQTLYD